MNEQAAIITREADHLPSLATALSHVKLVQQIMQEVMKKDVHYGPGFPGDTKMNLLKPGAEKLCLAFRLVPHASVTMTELPNGHREWYVVVKLMTPNGNVAGEGYGIASTMEPKHRYRNAKPLCPVCKKETVIKTERGWWCAPRGGGCGENPAAADIEKQQTGKVENQNPAECYNTCLKMAHKRALVHGTIQATAAGDIFTQDAEDIEEREEAAKAKEAERNAGPSATQTGGNTEAKPTPKEQAPAPQDAPKIDFTKWSKEGEAVVFKDLKGLIGLPGATACWSAYSKETERDARFALLKALASACFEIRDKLKDDGLQIIAEEVDAHGGKDMKRRAVDSLRDRLVRHSMGEGAANGEIPPGLND